jgi:ribonuclease HI
MIKVAGKYNTDLAALRLTPHLREMLPAWYHLSESANPRPITSVAAKCLLNNHGVTKVADLVQVSARIRTPEIHPSHQPNLLCICRNCVKDRIDGCRNPQACAEEARERLNQISPKLNPLRRDDHGNLSLTRTRKAANIAAKEMQGTITSDPTLTAKDDLAECFRIFVNPDRISNSPAERIRTRDFVIQEEELKVYTDGACMNNGKENAYCGSGVWIGPNHPWNRALKIPGKAQSNK